MHCHGDHGRLTHTWLILGSIRWTTVSTCHDRSTLTGGASECSQKREQQAKGVPLAEVGPEYNHGWRQWVGTMACQHLLPPGEISCQGRATVHPQEEPVGASQPASIHHPGPQEKPVGRDEMPRTRQGWPSTPSVLRATASLTDIHNTTWGY